MIRIATRLYNLALEAGFDLEEVAPTCDTSLESVIQNYCQGLNPPPTKEQAEQKGSQGQITTEKLVLAYLIGHSHLEVAQKFALKTGLEMDQEVDMDLETVCEDFIRDITVSEFKDHAGVPLTDRLNEGLIPTEFQDTDEVKFSRSNTRGAGIILTYKGFQHSLKNTKLKNGATYWQCRVSAKQKCSGFIHLKGARVIKFKEHSHEA